MDERTLFVGTNHRTLEQNAFEHAYSNAETGIGRVLYISETSNRHDRIQDHWRDSYEQLALRTETLATLVYDCYEQLEGPSEQLPEETDRRALEFSLDHIVADRPWLSTQSYASAKLVDAFDRRFARFQNVGLNTPERVQSEFQDSELPARIKETTVDAYERYYRLRETVSAPWQTTYSEAFEAVSQSNIADLLPHVDAIIVSGFIEPGKIEQDLLKTLFEAFPTAAILPTFSSSRADGVDSATQTAQTLYDDFAVNRIEAESGSSSLQQVAQMLYRNQAPDRQTVPGCLRWRELPTPEREARFVAREIRSHLADQTQPTDIGVVVPGFSAYGEYFEDIFDTFNLEYNVETGGAVTDTFVGSAVESLLSLSDENPRAADLTELVTNPVVDFFSSDGEDAVVAAERRIDSVRATAVQQQLSNELASEVQALFNRLSSLRTGQLAEAVETLRSELENLQIAEAVERDDSRIDPAQESAALHQVEELFDSFERADIPNRNLPASAAFLRALKGASVTGYTPSQQQVTVLDHRDAKEFAFDHLYIVGLTSEYFPSLRRYPAFFEQMVEAHPILEVLDDRLRDRYVFATLLGNADAVTLTTPSTDPDSTAVVRSPVLDELSRVTGIEPTTGVDKRIGSREDLQRAISPLKERRAALDAAGERGDLTADQTIRADRGIKCASERAEPDISSYDGVLEPETIEAVYPEEEREPYSASRIERYVNCGFQFYMEHVLGLEDDDDLERTPDPLETGTFVHDTFERFYAELQSEPGDDVNLRNQALSELETHMLQVALDELETSDFNYSGLFYRRWLEQLFAGLADPEENPYFGESRPHDGVERGLFARFIEREYSRDGDALPAWFEAPFGEGLPGGDDVDAFEIELPSGGAVEFRGYIDRVDINIDEGETKIQLLDYKTGYAPSMTKTTGGTTFQLPIYLLAAEQVLASDVTDVTDLSATYYQTKPPNKLKEPRGIESKFDSYPELRRFLDDTIPKRLDQLTTAIEHGRFHTTVLSQREAGCEYCAYQRSCDVRPHQRRNRVEAFENDPDTYVPIRATARDFKDEFGGEGDD
jgi:ATP-dependent helicase/nuclease subunit B